MKDVKLSGGPMNGLILRRAMRLNAWTWLLPGPWLEPGFRKKGHIDFGKNGAVIKQLIDRFNAMLKEVSAAPQFSHVHYLNLRNTLKHDGSYKKYGANELHPTEEGVRLVTKKFADLIAKL